MHAGGFLDFQEYARTFRSPLWTSSLAPPLLGVPDSVDNNWDFLGYRKQLLLSEVNCRSHVRQIDRPWGLVGPQEAERSPGTKNPRSLQAAALSWHLPRSWAICCLLFLMTISSAYSFHSSFLFPHNLCLLMAYPHPDLLASAPMIN